MGGDSHSTCKEKVSTMSLYKEGSTTDQDRRKGRKIFFYGGSERSLDTAVAHGKENENFLAQ